MTDTATREQRTCAKCGLTDNHAHHVQYVAFSHPVTGEGMDLSVTKHVKCCAEDGCEICTVDVAEITAAGQDVEPSDALDEFLQNRPAEALQHLFEQVSVESPDFQIPGTEEE
jgi:hypothetical protein